jgi:hypothetical protein
MHQQLRDFLAHDRIVEAPGLLGARNDQIDPARALRIPLVGLQRHGDLGTLLVVDAAGRSDATAQVRRPSAPRRSCISVVVVTAQPSPSLAHEMVGLTIASVMNT